MIPAAPLPLQPDATPAGASTRWQALWRDAIRDPRELLALLDLDAAALSMSEEAAAQFVMRVKAWPLPGLTYSVSVMTHGSLLTRIFCPDLTSFMPRVAIAQLLQIKGKRRRVRR